MELLCVRLITRRNPILSLPTYVKRRFRGPYRQTELTVKSPLLSSIKLSGKSFRTTDRVRDLVCRLPRFQPRPSLLISSRTGLVPAKTPVTTLPTHGSVSLPQHFHTSSPLRAIPAPLFWLILKPLQKILAIIVGRNIRKWWADLPPNRRQLFWDGAWRRRWQLVAGTTVAAAILAVILLTHLDESPVTGRTRILMVTREDYMELAAITADGYMEQYRDVLVPEQDSRHQAVQMMVQHLALRNRDIPQVASVSWRVHLVDDPAVNAFVLPNGEVFMFTGMLEAISDVHQLAIILGHEMAHALIEHAAEEASVSHILDFLFVLLLTAIWAVCPRDSLAVLGQWIQDQLKKILFSRPYSRKLETEADEVGLHLAAKACADVRAGPVLWQQMELRGGAAVPEWLSTHPSHSSRATHINSLVPQALEVRASCNCPPLPSADPRVVFSESVRALLGNAKKPLPPPAASSERRRSPATHALPGGVSVALLAPTQPGLLAPVPETTVVLAPAPETTVVLAPAPETTVVLAPAPETTVVLAPAPETTVVLAPAPETTVVLAPAPETTVVLAPAPETTVVLAPVPETTVVLAPALILAPAPETTVILAPAPTLTPDRPPPL